MVDAKILIQATVLDHFRFLCHYRVHNDIKSQNDPILEKIGKPGLKDQVLSITTQLFEIHQKYVCSYKNMCA